MLINIVVLLVFFALCGLALWALSQFAVDAAIQRVARVVVVVVCTLVAIVWLADAFGVNTGLPRFRP